jgi:uncharacterized membrane protein (UPF0127 family)
VPLEPPAARAADRRRPLIRVAVPALLLVGACACGRSGHDDAAASSVGSGTATELTSPGSSIAGSEVIPAPADDVGVTPEGFTTTTVRITSPSGEVCEVCVWLADTADERGRGLMGVTDLGGAAGMLFVFDGEVTSSFYMLHTPAALSIAWFAADGGLVGTSDMEPCLDLPADDCPRYAPGDGDGAPLPYSVALETWIGGLASLGIAEGARLEVLTDAGGSSGCGAR